MLIFETVSNIKQFVIAEKYNNKSIAFVPTMGVLHDGHLSLIEKAKQIADIVIVSIFVNKKQFNNQQDYQLYPKNLDSDKIMLQHLQVDALFMPQDSEIFSRDHIININVGNLAKCLCGSFRPNHFEGAALIVAKLFNIINPDFAIFGEKDFQQLLIIRKMVQDLNFTTKIISCPTVRDNRGLALSSRNLRLSSANIELASKIYLAMQMARKDPHNIANISKWLIANGFSSIDYFEIRNEQTLQLAESYQFLANSTNLRVFIAIYLQEVRLIDNLSFAT